MKIALISGGAAGMYCGSCIHDNSLAASLQRQGHDAVLVPLYTPLRTDEESVSLDRVFYGAVNTYLSVKAPFLRRLPKFVQRWLDRPKLLNWVGQLGSSSSAKDLGELTMAVLEGETGSSAGQLEQLVAWLRDDLKPEVVHLQNSLFLGLAHRLREELGVPIVCSLQGEDLFLDTLAEPYKSKALAKLRSLAGEVEAFVSNSAYYADHMSALLGLDRQRIFIVPMGLKIEDFHLEGETDLPWEPFTVGYLARICPEKGFAVAVEAFRHLAERAGKEKVRLKVAGYLGAVDKEFFRRQMERIREWGLEDAVEVVGEVDREGKLSFLRSVHALAVPTLYKEPKGLFAIESMACGVPVVLPEHGGFPEMLAHGGGRLVEPDNPHAVASTLHELMGDRDGHRQLVEEARATVRERHHIDSTARSMLEVYGRIGADRSPGFDRAAS